MKLSFPETLNNNFVFFELKFIASNDLDKGKIVTEESEPIKFVVSRRFDEGLSLKIPPISFQYRGTNVKYPLSTNSICGNSPLVGINITELVRQPSPQPSIPAKESSE